MATLLKVKIKKNEKRSEGWKFDNDCTFEVDEKDANKVEKDILMDDHVMRYCFWKETTNLSMKTTYVFRIKYGKFKKPRQKNK